MAHLFWVLMALVVGVDAEQERQKAGNGGWISWMSG
jgi:hypothetical protein